MLDKIKKFGTENLNNLNSMGKLGQTIVFIIGATIVFLVLAYISNKMTLNARNCTNMNNLYKDFPLISTISLQNPKYKFDAFNDIGRLRNYYIKSSFNSCAAGQFKNDYVNLCALKNCIKQGCRFLDFAVYSVNNEPVIAVSSVNDFNIKETYNSIPFGDVMNILGTYPFSGSACPNSGDPLLIHLRIMSKNKPIYKTMANSIYRNLEQRVLGKKYSYENNGKNLGEIELKYLMGKVVIIVDKSNALFEKTELDEYVNIASNSNFMRALPYNEISFAPSMNEMIQHNKKTMTICYPELGSIPKNPSALIPWKMGCQIVAMSFQNFDANLEIYNEKFDDNGSAFVLKPDNQRSIQVTIIEPPDPPAAYSYKERKILMPSNIPINISI